MSLQSKHDRFIKVKNIGVKPDFIIAGAMKSGTTSVHKISNEHPDIFISNEESVLFSAYDIDQNSVFLGTQKINRLTSHLTITSKIMYLGIARCMMMQKKGKLWDKTHPDACYFLWGEGPGACPRQICQKR